jgi:protein gp37
MGKDSKIEWTHHTFNPWWGCVEVSPACKFCYAKAFAKRTGHHVWGTDKPRRFFGADHWNEPYTWNEAAAKTGERHRVFCASMADIFEDYTGPDHDKLEDARRMVFVLINNTPHLQWLLLTKRPENMVPFTAKFWPVWPDNITAMTTVENQEMADLRIPELLKVPAKTRGLSMEPLLGPVDLLTPSSKLPLRTAIPGEPLPPIPSIDWIIVGGESGAGEKTRPTHPKWVTSIREYCEQMRVAFFFKQWGDWQPLKQGSAYLHGFHEARVLSNGPGPTGWPIYRVGKAKAGRLLDGREHNDLPAF